MGPETQRRPGPQLVRALLAELPEPHPGSFATLGHNAIGLSLRLPRLQPIVSNAGVTHLQAAGLMLPWSSGAGSHTVFSFASLAAAAWAQSGFCKPIASHCRPIDALQFAWPRIAGRLESPAHAGEMAPAAFAAVSATASPSMQVRLATPLAAVHKPALQMPLPPPIEDCPDLEAAEPVAPAPAADLPPKRSLLATLFAPNPRPVLASRPRPRPFDREESYSYDDTRPRRSPSSDAWRAMLAGWTPSAAGVSALFAILFLFSALAIFLSAPAGMSYRAPSFRWGNLRSAIRNRAVLKVEDDFRAGLKAWSFPAGWSQDWSYDQAGFLRPGKLGFLQQSMSLVNYRLELMGQIERKSLGWAFRAKDANNYYVAKLTVSRPGPLPMVDLIHYPVMNGKEGAKVRVPLPFPVRNDTLYQVEMNVRGDQFRASVNGHVVDSWNDDRLRAGGVGFVNGQGEASRVRWIRVSDRDDVIGRVCSYLSARAYQPLDESTLSASHYLFLKPPGL
jgi:hypothetical protein